jgi:hypothetical protein
MQKFKRLVLCLARVCGFLATAAMWAANKLDSLSTRLNRAVFELEALCNATLRSHEEWLALEYKWHSLNVTDSEKNLKPQKIELDQNDSTPPPGSL